MKTMAEVLVAHTDWATTNPDGEWLVTCVDCRQQLGTYNAIVPTEADRDGGSYEYLDKALAAHQADALAAAGYGPVREAAAQALQPTIGPEEFGVLYPLLKGGEPNRLHFYCTMPERNTLEHAEAARQQWIDRGENALVVSRQWKVL